jgi:type II secretory pathway pseudopilin PulG
MHAQRTYRRGFTLIEAALTTIIVGVGLVATLQLLATGTAANVDGAQQTTAINLGRNIRELTLKMTFDEVRAMHARSYSPAVDSRESRISGFEQWSQVISVQPVDRDRLTIDIVDPNPHAVRVTVRVFSDQNQISEVSWHRFRPNP